MNRIFNPETSAFILRVALAIVLISHSLYLKMVVYTLPGTAEFFASIGLPESLAYIVFFTEGVVGIALLIGFKTRLFSVFIIPILLGATWVHFPNGWLFSNTGGGWEYPMLLAIMAIAQLGMGDGKYAISAYLPSKNYVAAHRSSIL